MDFVGAHPESPCVQNSPLTMKFFSIEPICSAETDPQRCEQNEDCSWWVSSIEQILPCLCRDGAEAMCAVDAFFLMLGITDTDFFASFNSVMFYMVYDLVDSVFG